MVEPQACLNCGQTVVGKYCSHCGQRTDISRITLQSLVHDLPGIVLNLEKGLWYTLIRLTTEPGLAIREYLAGKRVRFQHPLAYLMFWATVCSFVMWLFPVDVIDETRNMGDIAQRMQQISTEFFSVVSIGMIPGYAACNWLFFRKAGYNLGEHLVFITYISAQIIILMTFMTPLYMVFSSSGAATGIYGAFMLLAAGYQLWTTRSWIGTAAKGWGLLRLTLALLVGFILNSLLANQALFWIATWTKD